MPIIVLVSLCVPKWREGLAQKYGFFDTEVFDELAKNTIWVHAVSYGEVKTVAPFIEELQNKFPEHKVFFSTGTLTGQKLARELFKKNTFVFYCPFDFYFAVKNWLDLIRPKFMVFVETEIWPELLFSASERKIPAFIINARLTERSVKRYKLLKPLFSQIMLCFTKIFAQSKADQERYLQIGAKPEQIEVLPNLKFDSMQTVTVFEQEQLKKQLNILNNTLVLIAGSTHAGEEEIVLKVFESLVIKFPDKDLRLILVPRHVERIKEVEEICHKFSFSFLKMSAENNLSQFTEKQVLLVDLMGKLGPLYAVSSIAMLGGTWAKVGGHNPLEPAAYGLPILVGPHTYKITDLVIALTEDNLLKVCSSDFELVQEISELLQAEISKTFIQTNLNETVSQKLCKSIGESLYC